jgi:integration host factor subunit alpha
VLFELDTEPLLRLPLAKHAEVSRFPAVTRDFAVVVPEQLAVQSMLDAMRAIGIDCLKSVSLFDLYRGQGVPAGCKSLAFRVIMQENQRTMTDQDADAVVASLLRVLSESFGASLRSSGEKMTLTKAELADMLFEKVGLNKREAKDMVETFFEEIREALEAGDSVKLSGFGNFQLRKKPQRPGRNPKTGEEIPITARRVVTFHASQKLKSLVEQAHGKQGK